MKNFLRYIVVFSQGRNIFILGRRLIYAVAAQGMGREVATYWIPYAPSPSYQLQCTYHHVQSHYFRKLYNES